jgi:RNA polymerase sigma-70 factor (ECF subfamily)
VNGPLPKMSDDMVDDFVSALALAKQGDDAAIATIWRALNPRLVSFLRARVGDGADDVASESWLAVARHLRDFEGGEDDFRAWLFTIARRKLIDWERRTRTRPTTSELGEVGISVPAPDDPEAETLVQLGTDAAVALVARLSPDQAEVLLLRVLAGLDTGRTAEVLGKRPGTVRMLQHRGLVALRMLLDDCVDAPAVTG